MGFSSSKIRLGLLEYIFVLAFVSVAFTATLKILGINVVDLFEYATVLLKEVFAWLF